MNATFVTFLFSSCLHEMVLIICTRKVRMYLFVLQMLQLPLIMLGRKPFIRERYWLGNTVYWLSMMFGPPLLGILYCREVFWSQWVTNHLSTTSPYEQNPYLFLTPSYISHTHTHTHRVLRYLLLTSSLYLSPLPPRLHIAFIIFIPFTYPLHIIFIIFIPFASSTTHCLHSIQKMMICQIYCIYLIWNSNSANHTSWLIKKIRRTRTSFFPALSLFIFNNGSLSFQLGQASQ